MHYVKIHRALKFTMSQTTEIQLNLNMGDTFSAQRENTKQ